MHELKFSRRSLLCTAAFATSSSLFPTLTRGLETASAAEPGRRSVVSVSNGDSRRKNVFEALVAIEDQIMPSLKTKKHVVIKPNLVSTTKQLAATHVDALHGILDFLEPRFNGPVVIAESSAGYSLEGFDNFGYGQLAGEHKPLEVSLVDLNEEGKYQTHTILNGDLHMVPVRLAARLLDPDAYIICCAILKTHNTVVATLSLKNMARRAPAQSPQRGPLERQTALSWRRAPNARGYCAMAQKLQPYWGATVLDGWEGMEGNGPTAGTAVPSRIAVASTDYVAADRVGVEVMGINPDWIGYLNFCAQSGLGQNDLTQIEIRGPKLADVTKKYAMHKDLERELRWMGPMTDVPEKLG